MSMNNARLLAIEPPESISKGVSITALEGLRPGSGAPVAILEFTVDPHASSEMGANPVTEVIQVLSGRGVVLSDNRELSVQAGDWVLIEPNVQHQVRNESPEVLSALSVSWAGRPVSLSSDQG
jgi:mannose-6-phosphate isomerase-like protein (cupin superfamily)